MWKILVVAAFVALGLAQGNAQPLQVPEPPFSHNDPVWGPICIGPLGPGRCEQSDLSATASNRFPAHGKRRSTRLRAA
jgi:hypothetical protein